MSVHVMVAIFDASGLTSTEKLVALAYAEHGHDDGSEARAGIDRICQYTALSRRTVQTTLKSLLEKRVLYVDRPATNKRPTCYKFFLTPDGKNLTMSGGAVVAPQDDSGGATDTARGATDDILGRDSCTQTVSEPLEEPSSIALDAERVYKAYPRKKGRPAALAAITKLLKSRVSVDELIASCEAYTIDRAGNDPKFILYPERFFGPKEYWRDFVGIEIHSLVGPLGSFIPSDEEWQAELERRHAEAVPAPKGFADSIRSMKRET